MGKSIGNVWRQLTRMLFAESPFVDMLIFIRMRPAMSINDLNVHVW